LSLAIKMASSKVKSFFRKVGDAVLGAGKLPSKLKRMRRKPKVRQVQKPGREVPHRLQSFFEQRHAGWSEYIMLKAQLAIIAMFVVAAIYALLQPARELVFFAALLVLSAYSVYLTLTQLKRAFERDYPAYRTFILMCVAIVWVFVISLRYASVGFSYESFYLALVPPAIVIGFVLLAFLGFRLKYGRDYTYGVVEDAGRGRAVVRIAYDLCSNVKHGSYVVDSLVKVKRGDLVKVKVERPMLGLRGSKVKAILGKVR